MGRFWVLALVLPLPGCFPPAVTLASFAADGVSYAASGKTVSDHGISLATARDCGLIRAVEGGALCVDRVPNGGVPVEDRRKNLYVVVGSYAERENAERAAQPHAASGVRIVPAIVEGRELHRVVVGPVSAVTAQALAPDAWKAPPPQALR